MGIFSNLFEGLKNSTKKFGFNSRAYHNVEKAVNEYNVKMAEPITFTSAKELSAIEEKLKKATNKYLMKRQNPKTPEGKSRRSFVEQVNNLVGVTDELRDPDKIKKFEREGKKLSDVVDVARNNKSVDISNKEKKVVGAGASKRIMFEYDGKVGFFTANEKIRSREKAIEEENQRLKIERNDLYKKMEKNNLLSNAENSIMLIETLSDSDVVETLRKFPGVNISEFTEEELKEVANYHKEIGKAGTLSETAEFEAGVVGNEGLSKRNVATSRIAGMVGLKDKIAVSKNIRVIDNGVELEGSFMEKAVGLDSRSRAGREALMNKEIDLSTGSLQRDINRMQVLDMVCGQVDRHGGNFFYQVSEAPVNGKYQIIGLQGIDNDMAFGNIKLDMQHKSLPSIDSLEMIDGELLTSLKSLTPEKIGFAMGELLNKDEIDAVISRRNAILEKVDKGEIRIVKSNEWGEKTLEETKKSPYYKEIQKELEYLSINNEKENDKIINSYDATLKRVEEYNKKHPNDKQELPKKPEKYDELKEKMDWKNSNARMVEYEERVDEYKLKGRALPDAPEGYEKYKTEKEAYVYSAKFEYYEKNIEEMRKYGIEPPKMPENYYEIYEERVRNASLKGNPIPAVPKGYFEYQKAKNLSENVSRTSVTLDEIEGKSAEVTHIQSSSNHKKKEIMNQVSK